MVRRMATKHYGGEKEVEGYTCPTITVTTEGISRRISGLISQPPGLGQCLCLGCCFTLCGRLRYYYSH